MFTKKVSGEVFEDIKSGKRNLELFINKDCDISVGDYILFKKLPQLFDGILTKVIDKKIYSSFDEMATIVSFKSLGFENKKKEDVVKFFESNFDKELVKECGVIVVKFELTN